MSVKKLPNTYKFYFNKQVMFYNQEFMNFLNNKKYVTSVIEDKYVDYFEKYNDILRLPELVVYPRNLKEYTELLENCLKHEVVYCLLDSNKKFIINPNTDIMVILIDTYYIKLSKL